MCEKEEAVQTSRRLLLGPVGYTTTTEYKIITKMSSSEEEADYSIEEEFEFESDHENENLPDGEDDPNFDILNFSISNAFYLSLYYRNAFIVGVYRFRYEY